MGVVLLVVGYRKNDRNLLLAAAIALILSSTSSGLTQGIVEGFMAAAK